MAANKLSIEEIRDAYVVCRTLGHSWDENPSAEFSPELYRTAAGALALRCTRCLTERYDYINRAMEVDSRTYKYPDGYGTIPGKGTRPNLRGEMLRRSLLIRSYNGSRPRRQGLRG